MSATPSTDYPRPFGVNWWGRLGWLLALLYGLYAADYLDVSWARFIDGLGNGARFLSEMVPVDFSRWRLLIANLLETVERLAQVTLLSEAASGHSQLDPQVLRQLQDPSS